ncbi:hypothetical protein GAG84_27405, partial [Bacteroides thetaiotaomicron]
MDRMNEYQALLQALSETPPALEGSVARAKARDRRRRAGRWCGIPMASLGGLAAAFVLLVLVFPFGYGKSTVGAQRWIRVPGIGSLQPSEVAKLGVILFFAARLSKRDTEKKKKYDRRKLSGRLFDAMDRIGLLELIPYGVVLVAVAGLMLMEPHMSGTILI